MDLDYAFTRIGKCYVDGCDANPRWIEYSWYRFCDEHVPEQPPRKKLETVWRFHTFS